MYKKIQQILSKGEHVLIKDKDNEYCVFSPFLDIEEDYRASSWCKTKTTTKTYTSTATIVGKNLKKAENVKIYKRYACVAKD